MLEQDPFLRHIIFSKKQYIQKKQHARNISNILYGKKDCLSYFSFHKK